MVKKKEEGIIEIIQKMVRQGKSNEEITKTLEAMGVREKEAKRLLLIAEANTFALLEREIAKIVEKKFGGFIEKKEKEIDRVISGRIKEKEKAFEKLSQEKAAGLEEKIKSLSKSALGIVEKTRKRTEDLTKEIEQLKIDIERLRLTGRKPWWLAKLIVGVGLLFSALFVYVILRGLSLPITIDETIRLIVVAIIAVTMFFVAALI